MKISQHDVSLLFENMTLLLMKQTCKEQEQLIRELFRSKFYGELLLGKIDIAKISPKEAVERFNEEEKL